MDSRIRTAVTGIVIRRSSYGFKDLVKQLCEKLTSSGLIKDLIIFSPGNDCLRTFKRWPAALFRWLDRKLQSYRTKKNLLIMHSNVLFLSLKPLERLLYRALRDDKDIKLYLFARRPAYHPILFRRYIKENGIYAFNHGPAIDGPWQYDPETGYLFSKQDGRFFINRQSFPEFVYIDTSVVFLQRAFLRELSRSSSMEAKFILVDDNELLVIEDRKSFLRAHLRRNNEDII